MSSVSVYQQGFADNFPDSSGKFSSKEIMLENSGIDQHSSVLVNIISSQSLGETELSIVWPRCSSLRELGRLPGFSCSANYVYSQIGALYCILCVYTPHTSVLGKGRKKLKNTILDD